LLRVLDRPAELTLRLSMSVSSVKRVAPRQGATWTHVLSGSVARKYFSFCWPNPALPFCPHYARARGTRREELSIEDRGMNGILEEIHISGW
jgi:hypothetical protein